MKPPITIKKSANCYDAIRALLDKKISRLLVEDEDNITGIVTQKDIGLFLLKDTTDRNLEQIPLKEIIKPLKSIQKSASINECAQFMLENQFGSIGVSDGTKIIGVITKTDLARYFQETYSQRKIVGEYMSPYYAWAYDDTPLYIIVKKMIDEKISRVILRDHNENPVGVLSFRDLFRTALLAGQEKDVLDNADPAISVVFARKGFLSETGFGGTTNAKEIMKDEIITVNYDDDLAKACSVLNENRIHGVGVLSKNGSLIGVLSKTDIIKALAFID
ncbi:MAG: CBS domain-containing protein [Crenarchaeota archaeon]|nr:MAG: CBS domain-containing protein [Thermoproteota archaeon]RDJ34337.1 MAG: CBS domain-containing protein [Thermoproteota archaeon]RDJ37199.1 MAG: CBS domain-containing protein [Thermoproteota archaeon]RDJ37921.1 MAG: CBS domain-containing protein [Thermoproteota archaeon]